jgi:2-oxoglutarate ferredoxin oxidoreductase subunit beta
MIPIEDYESTFENKWCPGCGNFGILSSLKDALSALNISPEKLLLVSGIGQAAKTPHFIKCNGFHSLHGRALPVATGAKMANHDLNIVVNTGDGDCYGEGGNHFIHGIRRNVDITVLTHNNRVYGLTKGQASPTSDLGMVTPMQHRGTVSESLNPLLLALAVGAGFVARGFSGKTEHLSRIIQQGIEYKGFSLIDILQPCVSFNRVNTYDWYNKRVYDIAEEEYRPDDLEKAMTLSRRGDDRIPIGILYRKEKPTFIDRIDALRLGPLVSRSYDGKKLQSFLADAGLAD